VNLFVLDLDPVIAARAQCDRHVVKMTLETAQILASVSARYGRAAPYRPTHARHPCTLWAGETRENWAWTVEHGLALADEYARRYGRTHASAEVVRWCRDEGAQPPSGARTPFAQAMPEQYRRTDAVTAYRAYYVGEKAHFAAWRAPASPPAWWLRGVR